MGGADVAAREHQVFDVFGIQAAVGDAVGLGQPPLLQVAACVAAHAEAAGQVIVDLPAAVGHGIGENGMVFHVVLVEDIVAHVPAAFPLAGQEAHPFQLPVLGSVVALVFHMIPHAKGNLEQLVTHLFGVADAVLHAAQLDPVKVGVDLVQVVGLEVHFLVGFEGIGPGGRGVGDGVIGLPGLEQDAHAHGVAVRLLQTEFLVEFCLALPAHAKFRSAEGSQDAVPRAIDEDLRPHLVPLVGGQLEPRHRDDAAARHFGIAAAAIEQQLDVGLKAHLFIEQAVPDGKIALGIAVHIVQQQLFQQAGFLQIPHPGTRAGDPHADLRAGVAAQHGPILHQNHLCAIAGGGNGGEHAADAASHHAYIGFMRNQRQFAVHVFRNLS